MSKERELVSAFGRCSRLINKFNSETDSPFLSQSLFQYLESFTLEFIIFLKNSAGDCGKNNVAQYRGYYKISSLLNNIIFLLKVSKNFNLIKSSNPLLLELELLKFQSLVLNFISKKESVSQIGTSRIKTFQVKQKPQKIIKKEIKQKEIENKGEHEGIAGGDNSDEISEKILAIIRDGDNLTIIDLSKAMPELSRRTIERKLNFLSKKGLITKDNVDRRKIIKVTN